MTPIPRSEAPAQLPTFTEALRFWLKLGLISFGGPTGQIAIMHHELVEKKRWISEARFLHALNYCMLLPGPEAQQLAIYVGWLLHKTWGGVIAGALFVIPSAFLLWALSWIYVSFGNLPWVAAIFSGLKPAVLAMVAAALIRIASKVLKNEVMWLLAALSFAAIHFFEVPFPLIIIVAGLIGFGGGLIRREKFVVISAHAATGSTPAGAIDDLAVVAEHTRPGVFRALRTCATWLVIWWLPVLVLASFVGKDHALFREAIFFSKAAMVTFGGAYAVLPYVSQQAVETYGWLTAGQMLDGLALAETTPGPLIMVLQFVGFLGGWNQPGTLPPLVSATLGAFFTTWTTFIPCFLWIFLGAPHMEQLRGNEKLMAALSAVSAAVVGVILNLAIWFAWHVIFPRSTPVNWFGLVISVVAFLGLWRWKWNVVPVVLGAGAAGLIYRLLAGGPTNF